MKLKLNLDQDLLEISDQVTCYCLLLTSHMLTPFQWVDM